MLRGVSTDIDHTSSLAPSYLDTGFGSDYRSAANPNALRRQTVNLDDALVQPKRESRRPPASAFQSAASQDCESDMLLLNPTIPESLILSINLSRP